MADFSQMLRWNANFVRGLAQSVLERAQVIRGSLKKELKKEETPKQETRGPQLGLGDFVFYSVLMGKAATYGDYNIILGCYVGISFGFLLTLLILSILNIPLPALPISVTLAVIIFFIFYFCAQEFLDQLNFRLIYI